jgi:hypothetical protein
VTHGLANIGIAWQLKPLADFLGVTISWLVKLEGKCLSHKIPPGSRITKSISSWPTGQDSAERLFLDIRVPEIKQRAVVFNDEILNSIE